MHIPRSVWLYVFYHLLGTLLMYYVTKLQAADTGLHLGFLG